MILRRLVANLRAQNWTAIGLELAIVIVGVFIGTQVSNWNEQRLERRQTERMLSQLQPELQGLLGYSDAVRTYYATTRSYADNAFAGWERRAGITDEQFVIAAYQASQITGLGTNGENWALIFGGDQLRNIEDPGLRRAMSTMMTFDFDLVDAPAVATKYREDVRRVIPDPVQVAIRARCGDRIDPDNPLVVTLPRTCDLDLPDDVAAGTAAALRRRPELADDLRWHLAAVAAFLENAQALANLSRVLAERIERD